LAGGDRRNGRRTRPPPRFSSGLADARRGFGLARAAPPLQDVLRRLPEAAEPRCPPRRRTLLPAAPAPSRRGLARDGGRRAGGKVGSGSGFGALGAWWGRILHIFSPPRSFPGITWHEERRGAGLPGCLVLLEHAQCRGSGLILIMGKLLIEYRCGC